MEEKCIMCKFDQCHGYTIGRCIGLENCKYGRSMAEQRAIEDKLVDSIQTRMPYLYRNVISLVEPGKVLIWANEHNRLRAETGVR